MTFPVCLSPKNLNGWSNKPIVINLNGVRISEEIINKDANFNKNTVLSKCRISFGDVLGKFTDSISSISNSIKFNKSGTTLTLIQTGTQNSGTETISVIGVHTQQTTNISVPYSENISNEFLTFINGSFLKASYDYFLTNDTSETWIDSNAGTENAGTVMGYNSIISRFLSNGFLNSNIWTNTIDLSGIATSSQSYGTLWLPTLISPNACVTAKHINGLNSHPVGNWIRWTDNNGVTYQRSVISQHTLGKDLLLLVLDSVLPSNIKPFSLINKSILNSYAPGFTNWDVPAYFVKSKNSNQSFGGNILTTLLKYSPDGISSGFILDHAFILSTYGASPAPGLLKYPSYGDSGGAVFITVDERPILLGTITTGSTCESVVDLYSDIALITDNINIPSMTWTNFS